jgi:hypothetical protein
LKGKKSEEGVGFVGFVCKRIPRSLLSYLNLFFEGQPFYLRVKQIDRRAAAPLAVAAFEVHFHEMALHRGHVDDRLLAAAARARRAERSAALGNRVHARRPRHARTAAERNHDRFGH